MTYNKNAVELTGNPQTNAVMMALRTSYDDDAHWAKMEALADEILAQEHQDPAADDDRVYFITSMDFTLPNDMRPEAVKLLYAYETSYAIEEIKAGTIERMFRLPGTRGNFIVWHVKDASELHQKLAGLPLWRFVGESLVVHAVARHPMDPGPGASASAWAALVNGRDAVIDELAVAGRRVVERWESGDLADAVAELDTTLQENDLGGEPVEDVAEVHVDWRMTVSEWRQLRIALLGAGPARFPYIQRLLAEGKLNAVDGEGVTPNILDLEADGANWTTTAAADRMQALGRRNLMGPQADMQELLMPLTWANLTAWLLEHGVQSQISSEGLTAVVLSERQSHALGFEGVLSVHNHPSSGRPREIHVMVDDTKICELGPTSPTPGGMQEDIAPGYVDFVAEWEGRPVHQDAWRGRIMRDNGLSQDTLTAYSTQAVYENYEHALDNGRETHRP